MKIISFDACYTGGGIYSYIGETDDGDYLMAADDWGEDMVKVNSHPFFDKDECWSSDWIEDHWVGAINMCDYFPEGIKWMKEHGKTYGNFLMEELEERVGKWEIRKEESKMDMNKLTETKYVSTVNEKDIVRFEDICKRYVELQGTIEGFEEYVKSGFMDGNIVEYIPYTPMPPELKSMLDELLGLVECGAIRSYYDSDAPKEYQYKDSSIIHNLFATVEDVAFSLRKGDVDKAEQCIKGYALCEFVDREMIKKIRDTLADDLYLCDRDDESEQAIELQKQIDWLDSL